jgi:hypothetical protein
MLWRHDVSRPPFRILIHCNKVKLNNLLIYYAPTSHPAASASMHGGGTKRNDKIAKSPF